jgi:phosphatidylinositol-3-phosphatase
MRRLIVLACLVAVVSGMAVGSRDDAAALGVPTAHLAIIVMENKEYGEIIDNPNAPYINETLVPNGRLFTRFYAVTHPSLPDYLVLTGGSMAGCVSGQCSVGSVPNENIFHQMNGASISWKLYAESMPSNCYPLDSDAYLVRHNPAPYYRNLGPRGDGTCFTNDVPYGELASDMAAGVLPQFLWITPNQYNDMHTDQGAEPCLLGSERENSICRGDLWLRQNLPPILSNNGSNDVTAIIVFDEGTTDRAGGGQVVMIEIGSNICGGCTSAKMFTHYGLLQAIDKWFGLASLVPRIPDL